MSIYSIPTVPEYSNTNLINVDIFSKLLKNREILCFGEISQETSIMINSQLLYLDSVSDDPITIYLNSGGGSVYDGLAIIDTMRYITSDVKIVCTGVCASMAAVILASGDQRYATPNSRIMLHQVSTGDYGNINDLNVTIKATNELNDLITSIMSDTMGITKRKYKSLTNRDLWLTPKDAIKYRIIDGIQISK